MIDPTLVRPVAEQVAETARLNEALRSEVKRLQLLLDLVTGQINWATQQIHSDVEQLRRERARRRYLASKAWRLRQELRNTESELRRYI